MKELFTIRELSTILRVKQSTLYRFCRKHEVPGVKKGRSKLYKLAAFHNIEGFGQEKKIVSGFPRILFVNPSLRLGSKLKIPPVGLASVMAAVDEKGIPFEVFDIDINDWRDAVVEAYIKFNKADIIAFGCIVTHYKWVKWFSKTIKKYHPTCKIIVGNSVGGSCFETLMRNAPVDFVVIGEGEDTTLELIDVIEDKEKWPSIKGIVWRTEDGRIVQNERRTAMRTLDNLPRIPWDRFFDISKYISRSRSLAIDTQVDGAMTAFPISSARGCAFRCSFCHFVYWDDPYRYKSPSRIVSEMRDVQSTFGVNYVAFWDDLSFASLAQVERFSDELIASGIVIQWSAAVRADLFGNKKHSEEKRKRVAKKMRQAGCTLVGFSLESGDPEILSMMNKRIEPEFFTEQVRLLREVGIKSGTSVVFGYPIETKETIKKTFQMCLDIGVYPSIGYLLPLPATGMYKYAIENGFIENEDKYLDAITERQDLIINMTSLSDEEVKNEIARQAENLNVALNLGLKDLVRTKNAQNEKSWKRNKNDVSLDYSRMEFDSEVDAVIASAAD